jgi:hypothetical protein
MDIKIVFTIIATIIGIIAFLPYLRDIFLRKTKPHAYTWLIWTITQITAIVGILLGGGGWGALNLIVGTLFVISIFLFSLKYGSKNITRLDTIILITALLAIIIWWRLNQPLIAIIMVSVIDFLGYIPSFRKSYQEPWSETLSFWLACSLSNIFAILALSDYNFLTVTYIATITVANVLLFLFCLFRRKFVTKPKSY